MTRLPSLRDKPSFLGPSILHSTMSGSWIDATNATSLGNSHSRAIESYPAIPASILRLLDWRGPSAIARRVVCIVVDSVNRHPWWPDPHVCRESIETSHPTVTDGNATSTICGEVLIFRIRASLPHRLPRLVSWIKFSILARVLASRSSMCHRPTAYRRSASGASATVSVSSRQIAQRRNGFSSTFALTSPMRMFSVAGMKADSRKPSKFSACYVARCAHVHSI